MRLRSTKIQLVLVLIITVAVTIMLNLKDYQKTNNDDVSAETLEKLQKEIAEKFAKGQEERQKIIDARRPKTTYTTHSYWSEERRARDETITCSQEYRKRHLLQACAKRDTKLDRRFPHVDFYIDKERNLGYCYIYKAGSTSWLNAFHVANGKKSLTELGRALIADPIGADAHFPSWLQNTTVSREHYEPALHDGLTKFIVVRHPFDRLISTYYQKIASIDDQFFRPVRNVLRTYYFNESSANKGLLKIKRPTWVDRGRPYEGVTFAEFARFIIDERSGKFQTDVLQKTHQDHFVDYFSLCYPCEIHYDFILRTETMSVGAPAILSLLGLPGDFMEKMQFNVATQRKNAPITTQKYLKEFEQLTLEEIKKLHEIYRHDFDLFGYGFDENFKTSCNIDESCC